MRLLLSFQPCRCTIGRGMRAPGHCPRAPPTPTYSSSSLSHSRAQSCGVLCPGDRGASGGASRRVRGSGGTCPPSLCPPSLPPGPMPKGCRVDSDTAPGCTPALCPTLSFKGIPRHGPSSHRVPSCTQSAWGAQLPCTQDASMRIKSPRMAPPPVRCVDGTN